MYIIKYTALTFFSFRFQILIKKHQVRKRHNVYGFCYIFKGVGLGILVYTIRVPGQLFLTDPFPQSVYLGYDGLKTRAIYNSNYEKYNFTVFKSCQRVNSEILKTVPRREIFVSNGKNTFKISITKYLYRILFLEVCTV